MSGFAAIVRLDGQEVEPDIVRRMTAAMAYRGPDAIAHWSSGSAAIGHCLMRCVAQNEPEQPLRHEETGVVVAMDGYLANWEELRADLAQRISGQPAVSDAELILQAYLIWGAECGSRLDGEFACVLWDARRQELLCLKDHHGLRPLYYYRDDRVVIAASEISAVLAALPHTPALNRAYVAEIATDQSFTTDETIWQGIKRLLPAHAMHLRAGHGSSGHVSLCEYWTLPIEVSTPIRSDGEYIEAYRAVFAECVRRASRSHLPVACEVSGGLDSSAVFAMAHHLSSTGKLPAPSVQGFTLAGPPGTDADEVAFARAVGRHLGVPIHEKPLFCPDLDWFAQRAAQDFDVPPLPNAAMSLELDRAAVAQGCRVTLTGVGGDQWLNGTHFYYRELLENGSWLRLFAQYRADISGLGLGEATSLLTRLGPGSYVPQSLRHGIRDLFLGTGPADTKAPQSALRVEYQEALKEREARYLSSLPDEYRANYKLRKLKFPRWTSLLDQVSRQRARSGLEMRNPMMSRAFIEFSTTTPEHMRLRGGVSKYIHRRALGDLLPPEVLWRDGKAEFSTTYYQHDRELRQHCTQDASGCLSEMFHTDVIDEVFDLYLATPIDERCTAEIWGMYVTALLLQLECNRLKRGTD